MRVTAERAAAARVRARKAARGRHDRRAGRRRRARCTSRKPAATSTRRLRPRARCGAGLRSRRARCSSRKPARRWSWIARGASSSSRPSGNLVVSGLAAMNEASGQPVEPQSTRRDPITLEVLWTRLRSVADEAAKVIVRTSFSTLSIEANDFSVRAHRRAGPFARAEHGSIPSFIATLPRHGAAPDRDDRRREHAPGRRLHHQQPVDRHRAPQRHLRS